MSYNDHAKVSDIRYEKPTLSAESPIFITPEYLWTPIIDPDNVAYYTLFKPFNLANYLNPRLPIDLGLVELPKTQPPNVLRMPIKFPDHAGYIIPKEMKPLEELIRRVVCYEKFINPNHDDCFSHITYDRSAVKADEFHRFPGFHGDGIQGTKLTPKVNVEHSYILTTDPPTEFCVQPFFLKHLDESKHNFFLEFDKQAKESNIYQCLPNHLYLIDPYMVHRTPRLPGDASRTFLRITFAFTELQHPKNTINPLFTGQEYEKRIDIRENLCKNEFDVPYHLYGVQYKE